MKRPQLKNLIITLAVTASLLLAGCGTDAPAPSAEPVVKDGYYLDTVCSISVYRMTDEQGEVKDAAGMAEEAGAAIDEALELCGELEAKLSRTKAGSEISLINDAGGEWTEVSPVTTEIIQKGIEYSRLSGGAFDITVGGLTEQWDFHAPEGEAKIPDEEALAAASEHVDYSQIEIEGSKVRLTDPESKLELGGIAKGFIGDKMTEALESRGVVSAVINLGGNVICIGGKTDADDFVIGVETPFSDRTEIIGKINSRDKTLVTSGVYERRIVVDGKSYHHILDTETGWPVETDVDAVTVIADKGRSADMDAASTICIIKGAEEGKRFIEEEMTGVEAVFVLSDGSIITTDGAGFEEVE